MKWLGNWGGIKRHSWSLDKALVSIEEIAKPSFKYRNFHWGAQWFSCNGFLLPAGPDQLSWLGRRGSKERFSIRTPSRLHPAPGGHSSNLALLTPQAVVALRRAERRFPGTLAPQSIRTDAKPVYCVYYAVASGVTYLNPCASQRGECSLHNAICCQ